MRRFNLKIPLWVDMALQRLHIGTGQSIPVDMLLTVLVCIGSQLKCLRCRERFVTCPQPGELLPEKVRCPRCERELLGSCRPVTDQSGL